MSAAGRPRLAIQMMAGLLYLKHAHNKSEESACKRWAEKIYIQHFMDEEYFQSCLPCDPINLVRFR
ncbi:hypothetical protein AWB78_08443 [Caballeronia calidae]|uniref:Transposase InsH N-terminal domain-containing protein n=1 Tax=Caballeronia calidae TaxID=1777139 RepID=A0A158EJR9_9BURK|nr:hypothetical protein AWB78_08443 [Caballeronia calidae]